MSEGLVNFCQVVGCSEEEEAVGLCRRHYRNFLRFGDPLQAGEGKDGKKTFARDGVCSVPNCTNKIQAQRLCSKHYKRMQRTGTTSVKEKRIHTKPDQCLVFGCKKPHASAGLCTTHSHYKYKFGSPYIPKVVKLCGVYGCEEIHWRKGLCKQHFGEWGKVQRKYGI